MQPEYGRSETLPGGMLQIERPRKTAKTRKRRNRRGKIVICGKKGKADKAHGKNKKHGEIGKRAREKREDKADDKRTWEAESSRLKSRLNKVMDRKGNIGMSVIGAYYL